MTMKTRPTTRFTHLSLRVVALLALCGSALAQQVAAPPTLPGSAPTDTASSASDTTSSSTSPFNQRTSLTASQIITILQQRPELVVELKSLVADQLQQQGIQTQADSISDEMLLSQISTNAQLRASITVWLRARGYVSAAEMDRLLSSDSSDEDSGLSPFSSSSSLLTSTFPTGTPLDGSSLLTGDRSQGGLASGGPPSLADSGASAIRTRESAARRSGTTPDRSRSITD